MATMAENVIAAGSETQITVKDTYGVTDIRRPQRLEDLDGQDKLRYELDRVKELMEGTKMIKQERESMLYDEFDKFTSEPRESIHSYYLKDMLTLINGLNMIPLSMNTYAINTSLWNHL
ncbi:hypothetical protein Tco_1228115 [Tanacetum coccineum]